MFNKAEVRILGLLMKQPLELYSINRLAKETNLAYPYIYNSVKKLEKAGLVKVRTAGKSCLCQIRFDEPEELALAALENTKEFLSKHPAINNLTRQLKEALADELYILLLFGSYAKGKATSKSDIDLFFVIKNEADLDGFRKKVTSAISKLNYKIEFEVSNMSWFYEMLGDKTTVGREIFKTNIILHNPEAYFYLVKRYDQRKGY